MTGDEAAFHDRVGNALRREYANVQHEPTLPSGREPDFLAESWLFTLAVEVEYAPQDVTGDVVDGAGQAMMYAGEVSQVRADSGVVPVVVCNQAGFVPESAEMQALRSRLPVVPLSE